LSDILKICGIAVIAVVLGVILRSQGSVLSRYSSESAAVIILSIVVLSLEPLINLLKKAFDGNILNVDLLPIVLKTAAIAIICQITSDICKDHGENTLVNAVEFAGNASIIIMSLPVLKALLSDVFSLLKT